MVSFLDAPSISAYDDDPEYLAASKAASDLLARTKNGATATREERRLFRRYNARMDAAYERAKAAHDAFLTANGLHHYL